jgi:tRNA1(Val) A37 N6-methylase TrmN6
LENSLKVIEFIKNTNPKNVLELGSYNGILLNYLSNKNDKINFTGIDLEEKIINFAKKSL